MAGLNHLSAVRDVQVLWLKYIRLQIRNNTTLRLGTVNQIPGSAATGYLEVWGRLLIDRSPNWGVKLTGKRIFGQWVVGLRDSWFSWRSGHPPPGTIRSTSTSQTSTMIRPSTSFKRGTARKERTTTSRRRITWRGRESNTRVTPRATKSRNGSTRYAKRSTQKPLPRQGPLPTQGPLSIQTSRS